jgi:hypothetical protein
VSAVFREAAERQGAYDFLENANIRSEAVAEPMFRAAARRITGPYALIAVDGSSLTLTDRQQAKGLGAIGTRQFSSRGLKVISAYALDHRGVPWGLLDQRWWARPAPKKLKDRKKRPLHQKETRHWVDAIESASERLRAHAPQTRPWFLVDREGDSLDLLNVLANCGALFTIRSNHDRRLQSTAQSLYLSQALARSPVLGTYRVDVAAGPGRIARTATLAVRVTQVVLRLRNRLNETVIPYEVGVVQAREIGWPPKGEKRLEWRLLTNAPLSRLSDARRVIFTYAQRWRIEEFHRTWKSGVCDVESCQLRRVEHIIKWATIMAAVAARVERLKLLSRAEPELPADQELTENEVAALLLLKRRQKKRTETVPNRVPTLGQAVLWIAELGGYTGKSSGGPPGSVTIRRGFDDVLTAAAVIDALEKAGRLR